MSINRHSMANAKAVADLAEGGILATVEVGAPPERIFRALTSTEIIAWWIRPGVFNTSEWTADVRPGGSWRASGTGGGPTTVTYRVDAIEGGSRITLHQGSFASAGVCMNTCIGWETSFEQLARFLSPESPPNPAAGQ